MANAGQPSSDGDKRQGAEIVPLPWIARRRSRRAARLPESELRDPDDYVVSTRTLIVIGIFLALLIGGSVWLLDTMRKNRILEECLMAGRKNCTPIVVPAPQR